MILGVFTLALSSQVAPCNTDENYKKQIQTHPEIENNFQQYQQIILAEKSAIKKRSGKIIIPVVVHIMHNNGIENITDEQVQDAIDHLNIDYSRLNSDTVNTRNIFKGVAASPQIEFRLATKTPEGKCTNGIVRYQTKLTDNADDNIKGLSSWNSDYYYNIWVVKSIASTSTLGTILGYAQFPWTGLFRTDGVIVRHDMVGTIGTATGNNYKNRTLTHETGHWLGLFHTFQDGCGSNDYCDDTPPVANPSFNICLPASPNTCTKDVPDLLDQYENYMDYSDGRCQNMFTKEQVSIMWAQIKLHRSMLTTDENLKNTGVVNPLTNCGPKAQFYASNTNICNGNTVTFKDISYQNTNSLNYQWYFENGTPSTSNFKNPVVTYNDPSHNKVTLIVSNTQGSDTLTLSNYIHVLGSWVEKEKTLSESFENQSLPNGWHLEGNTVNNWERTNTAAYSGKYSLMITNGFGKSNAVYKIISKQYDASGTSPILSFKYSFCQRNTNGSSQSNDQLLFKISLDCGKTWLPKWNSSGTKLNTLSNSPSSIYDFFPPDQKAWKSISVDLSGLDAIGRRNILFAWEFVSDAGNNIFLDDINLGQTLNTHSEIENQQIYFTNPSSELINLQSELFTRNQFKVELIDLSGRSVYSSATDIGKPNQLLSTQLSSGTYILTLDSRNIRKKFKIIIQ